MGDGLRGVFGRRLLLPRASARQCLRIPIRFQGPGIAAILLSPDARGRLELRGKAAASGPTIRDRRNNRISGTLRGRGATVRATSNRGPAAEDECLRRL